MSRVSGRPVIELIIKISSAFLFQMSKEFGLRSAGGGVVPRRHLLPQKLLTIGVIFGIILLVAPVVSPFDQRGGNWAAFCSEVEQVVNSYDFQSSRPSSPPTPEEQRKDWISYLEKHSIVPISGHLKKQLLELSRREIEQLGNILEFALEPPQISCSTTTSSTPTTVTIKGNFIVMSKVVPQIAKACPGGEATQVHFYAGHTIFLDEDLILEEADVLILAPHWEAPRQGEQSWELRLEGRAGASYSRASAPSGNPGTGENGWDGCAGRPGAPGGSMFGLASKIISKSKKLVITSQGGNGGPGQHGGDGGDGVPTTNAVFPKSGTIPEVPDPWHNEEKIDLHELFVIMVFWPSMLNKLVTSARQLNHHGIAGNPGGNGGNGGVGGAGGASGFIEVVSFLPTTQLELERLSGACGVDGGGGKWGRGSAPGHGYSCKGITTWSWFTTEEFVCEEVQSELEFGRDGKGGAGGVSKSCTKTPKAPREITKWIPIVNYITSFFNQSHPVTLGFLEDIATNPEMAPYLSLKGLAEESLALEKIPRTKFSLNGLIHSYSLLITKLENYSKIRFSSLSADHQHVLQILLTSVYSSMMVLRASAGQGVILDVAAYFEVIDQQIELLNRGQLTAIIHEEKQSFQKGLEDKIEQAGNFLEHLVFPAILEAGKELNHEIGLIKTQLAHLVRSHHKMMEETEKKLNSLKSGQSILEYMKIGRFLKSLVSKLCTPILKDVIGATALCTYWDATDLLFEWTDLRMEDNEGKIEELERLVERWKIEEETHQHFLEELEPLVDPLLQHVTQLKETLESGGGGGGSLRVESFQVGRKVRKLKAILEEMMKTSAALPLKMKSVEFALGSIVDALDLGVGLAEMMEGYQETVALAGYIAAVGSASDKKVEIRDPELAGPLKDFEKKVRANLLDWELKRAIQAFKQWAFPFAKFYFGVDLNHSIMIKNCEPGSDQQKQIKHLQLELKKKLFSTGSQDRFIFQQNFTSGLASSKPFFRWENQRWRQEIELLLSGREVHLEADVRVAEETSSGWDAIKFRRIELNLKLSSSGAPASLQNQFSEVIKGFGMSMTHSGSSHYKFGEEYFVMEGSRQEIKYGIERDPAGNRVSVNNVYSKLSGGDPLLSPYTWWTFQLEGRRKGGGSAPDDGNGFEELAQFAPYIDLELVGSGSYVDAKGALKAAGGGGLELDKFYKKEGG